MPLTAFVNSPPRTRGFDLTSPRHQSDRVNRSISDADARMFRTMKRNYSGAPIMSTYRASRLPVSCRPCREKKRRCDRNQPCSNCTQRRLTCVYENGSRATNPLETDTLPERNPGEASVDPNGSTLAFSPLRQLDLLVNLFPMYTHSPC